MDFASVPITCWYIPYNKCIEERQEEAIKPDPQSASDSITPICKPALNAIGIPDAEAGLHPNVEEKHRMWVGDKKNGKRFVRRRILTPAHG